MSQEQHEAELRLSTADLDRAANEGVISREDADRLVKWGYARRFETSPVEERGRPAEQAKGFNLVTSPTISEQC